MSQGRVSLKNLSRAQPWCFQHFKICVTTHEPPVPIKFNGAFLHFVKLLRVFRSDPFFSYEKDQLVSLIVVSLLVGVSYLYL